MILAAAQIALFRPFPGIAFTATAAPPGPGRTGRRRQGTFYPSKDRALFSGCRTWVLRDRLIEDVLRHVGHALQDDATILLVGR